MSNKQAGTSSIQDEYEAEKKINDQLLKECEDEKKKYDSSKKKHTMLLNLTVSLQKQLADLEDQFQKMKDEEEQKRQNNESEYKITLAGYDRRLEESKVPLEAEKSRYEMINDRYKSLLERWEAKRTKLQNSIAEKRYTKQLVQSKIHETRQRVDEYKKMLKAQDPSINLDDDPSDNALSLILAKQQRAQQEAREKHEQLENLERHCRDLKKKSDLLRRNLASME